MSKPAHDYCFTILLLGDCHVGITSIYSLYTKSFFSETSYYHSVDCVNPI